MLLFPFAQLDEMCPTWLHAVEPSWPIITFALKYVYLPCLLLMATSLLWIYYNYVQIDRRCSLPVPPGSFGLPIAGETLTLMIEGAAFSHKRLLKHGKMFTTHLLGYPTIRVIGADLVAKLLQHETRFIEVQWPKSAQCLLGPGCLANTCGKLHRQHKQMLLQAFSPAALDLYAIRSQQIVRSSLQDWCKAYNIKTYAKCRELTFEIACEVLLGFQMTAEERCTMLDDFQIYVDSVFSLPFNVPIIGFGRGMKARKRLLSQINEMLNRDVSAVNEDTGLTVRFLKEISEKSEGTFNHEEICNSALELLFTGHETLSSATCTLIEHLGQRPDVVEKLRKELDLFDLLPGTESDLSMEVLRRLHYLDNVIREVLRVQPPVGAGLRIVKETFELGGYQMPKGWLLAYCIRDTVELWSDQMEFQSFDPDRWDELDPEAAAHNFFPFGQGVRICLGREYARLVLKLLAVEVVRHCDVFVESKKRDFHYLPTPHPKDYLPAVFTAHEDAPVTLLCSDT